MAKPEWGKRYACFSCGCKFYDLNRPEPLCPRCGADQREATQELRTAVRSSRASSTPAGDEAEPGLLDDAVEVDLPEALLDEEEEEVEVEDEEEY